MADDELREKSKVYIKRGAARLSFPHLKEPHASVKDGKKKYRAVLLIDKSTPEGQVAFKSLQAAKAAVYKDAWPKAKKPPIKADRNCVSRGPDNVSAKTGEVYNGYDDENIIAIKCANDSQPTLLTKKKGRIGDNDIERILYAGCYVEAQIRFYAITDQDKGGNGFFCTIEGVRFWGDGESFGGGGVSEDDFDDYDDDDFEDEDDDEDDDDDDMPL